MKNTVKLNEAKLRKMISESVENILKEYGYDSCPRSGYERFSEIGEGAAIDAMRELKQYNDIIDEEALQKVLDGFRHSFMALCKVGNEELGIKGYGIKLS